MVIDVQDPARGLGDDNGLIAPTELTQKGFLPDRTFSWTQLL
jgi:hypothetical protein